MGSRYLITGADLGMIEGFTKAKQPEEIIEVIRRIIKENYCGYSKNTIKTDCNQLNIKGDSLYDVSERNNK